MATMMRCVRWWATLVVLVGAVAACETTTAVSFDAAAPDVIAPDGGDADVLDATAEPTDDRGAAEAGAEAAVPDVPDAGSDADAPSAGDADVTMMADADASSAGDADVPATDADVPAGGDADVATGDVPDAGPAGPPRMTFTFVSAALNGGTTGGPQMRATITWHGMLRGENDAGVRLEAFFR